MTETSLPRAVGVIGLGIMGGAMARNLARAGFSVTGFDLDEARRRELAADRIAVVGSPQVVAEAAGTIVTSLPSAAALTAVAATLAGATSPLAIVETSTLALADKLAAEAVLRERGHTLLDCPVSGTGAQAARRDIVVYASGDSSAIQLLRPVFDGFARATHDVGTFGNGSRMKFVANLLVAIHNVASAEAMVLGMKAGLDPHQLVELVRSGVGNSRIFELRAPMMADNRYEPATMRISTWEKDMAVIAAFAEELGSPTPLFTASAPLYAAALEAGLGNEDTASVCRILEGLAGLHRRG